MLGNNKAICLTLKGGNEDFSNSHSTDCAMFEELDPQDFVGNLEGCLGSLITDSLVLNVHMPTYRYYISRNKQNLKQ